MTSPLVLGFLIGMRHALEADHVAAVAALTAGTRSVGDAVWQGAVWGLGHTVPLFLFGSMVLVLDLAMPARLAEALELAVGVMLIGLGMDVLRRLYRGQIQIQRHRHADGMGDVHADTQPGSAQHDRGHHGQAQPKAFPSRALFVGLMHGMAGSAALILLTIQSVQSPVLGLVYIVLFGAGSIAGMAALSVAIALPLRYQANGAGWFHAGMHASIGVASVALGGVLIYELAPRVLT